MAKKVEELKKKNIKTEKDVENWNAGKKSMGTMFKTDVGSLQSKITSRESEIEY